MPTSVFYGYSPNALVYDPGTGTFMLDPDYNFGTDRVRFEVTDDDNFLDGDEKNNEVGEDSNQTGVVTAPDGAPISSGLIYGEQFAILRAPDGSYVTIDRIEIGGQNVGYVPSEPLQPGVTYSYAGGRDIDNALGGPDGDDTRLSYSQYEANSVPCFGPGTMIQTENGEMPVEWLETSDMVLTRDHGYQPIRWIGRTKLPPGYFRQNPDARPLCIPAGSLGAKGPAHDLHVTGDHRVLIASAKAEALFFSNEVLAPAKAWLDSGHARQIDPASVYSVTHIACAQHQIILAQGAWVETLFPGRECLRRLSAEDATRLQDALGETFSGMRTARQCVSRKEAGLLIEPIRKRSLPVAYLKTRRHA
ncbi:Hint domain-containing protein [Roseobacter sp. YSTF-M11]|uniref:Hint domain-containing protein n=1 Tax=Roseobacter insulae TaxID=2859783 RepID=A0A9X1FXM5_9RHOB|nr:Hint domain-containing protein [Roseobacter insulae]MBW4709436.1 Hint domain-containing protein [Roseobacter insulae]